MRRETILEAASVAIYTTLILVALTGTAFAAGVVADTDYLSRMDPVLTGAFAGFAGGSIRALRNDVPTKRALAVDAVPGGLAGAFAWPLTLSIFGPVLSTLQSTADVVLTFGAKVGVAAMLTGACLSVFIGAAESVFKRFTRKDGGGE